MATLSPFSSFFLFLTGMITVFLKFFKPSLKLHRQNINVWSWNKMGLLKFSPTIHHTKLFLNQFLLWLVSYKKMIFHLLPSLLWLFPITDFLFLEHLVLWTDPSLLIWTIPYTLLLHKITQIKFKRRKKYPCLTFICSQVTFSFCSQVPFSFYLSWTS